jgi:hypothetical protein
VTEPAAHDRGARPAVPEPATHERPAVPEPRADRPHGRQRFVVPLLALLIGAMLIVQALAATASREGRAGAQVAYWISFAVIVAAAVGAQLLRQPTRGQRLALVIATGVGLYMIKVLSYPNSFTYYDELSHYRTATDILRFGRLFHTNPVLAVSPYYPGMEIVSSALVRLTGLSLTTCGLLALGAGRVLLAAALYGLFAEVTDSPRVGGLGAVLYMANPSFLYFDSDFSYESFALPLAALALLLTVKWMRTSGPHDRSRRSALRLIAPSGGAGRGLFVGSVVALGAVTITHHTTSYLISLFLFVLCLCAVASRRWGGAARAPWYIFGWSVAMAGLWLLIVAPSTIKYLNAVFGPAIDGVRQVLLFNQSAYTPFSGGTAAASSPLWLKILAATSVLIILSFLPLGLTLVWRRRREAPMLAFAAVAAAYVPVQALRVTGAGIESANRSFEFVFAGVAVLLALCFTHLLDQTERPVALRVRGRRLLGRRPASAYIGSGKLAAFAVTAATILFVGGVIVLWPLYGALPGRYIPGADIRSITSEGIAAARWIRREYGIGQRVLTDRSNAQIVASYGDGNPVEGSVGSLSVARVFVSSQVDATVREILRAKHVQFLLVDTRLASAAPARGFYFTSTELNGATWTHPIALSWLTKFATTPGFSLVFDDGAMQVYRVLGTATS